MAHDDPIGYSAFDASSERLLKVLREAYYSVELIKPLLMKVRFPLDKAPLQRPADVIWRDVLEVADRLPGMRRAIIAAAADDDLLAAHRTTFESLLAEHDAAAGVGAETGALDHLAEVDRLLAEASTARSPVLVALETDEKPLTEEEFPRTERHLTVRLSPEQVTRISELVDRARRTARTPADLMRLGQRVWRVFTDAEPRLTDLLEYVTEAGLAQPIGWCGRMDLLLQLHTALLIAHTGTSGVDGFVTVGGGSHYFYPVTGGRRAMKQRLKHARGSSTSVAQLDLRGVPAEQRPSRVSAAAKAEVALTVASAATDSDADTEALPSLLAAVDAPGSVSPTRAVLAFGAPPSTARALEEMLASLPFVGFADAALADPDLLDVVVDAVRDHAPTRALPSIVGAVRAAWLRAAAARGDAAACLHGLTWSSWGWIGLPLFAREFGVVEHAAYPHLMDLRSIAGGWYFPRSAGIHPKYQAHVLAQTDLPDDDRFHLYLSGAGGSGKSCFLHDVYERLRHRRATVAVWYRVDSPSSRWKNVDQRVREETLTAVHETFGPATHAEVAQIKGELGAFLREAEQLLVRRHPDFTEIVVFIDQLERTFESGADPVAGLLGPISRNLVAVLEGVRQRRVRFFIASRKQYLPDFLRSFRTAAEVRLEFNVLQAISTDEEQFGFVDTVREWCANNGLVSTDLVIESAAARKLADDVGGEPLSMMLALIELLSVQRDGVITEEVVKQRAPRKRLFALDLRAAARHDVDWFFLLAMAHARAEIVGIDEVLWRLRMVRSDLTREVEELGAEGILERLWLFGFLGRTVHARPLHQRPGRLVEFFHANFRDHLLRDVMELGGHDLDLGGRLGGTPPAWRALDRLAVYARDWRQTQQLLPEEDVAALMEHRTVLIETHTADDAQPAAAGSEAKAFRPLFLRDPDDVQPALAQSAMECLVHSALVHDAMGRWAFEQLFPDLEERAKLCRNWMRLAAAATRPAILRYFVELPGDAARESLIGLLLDDQLPRDEIGRVVADILAEPMYAARYRDEVVAALLAATLPVVGGDPLGLPGQVTAIVVAACRGDADTLAEVVRHCSDRYIGSDDAVIRNLAPRLESDALVGDWLAKAEDLGVLGGMGAVEGASADTTVLALAVGEHLRGVVDEARFRGWMQEVRDRIGVPLPTLQLTPSEVAAVPAADGPAGGSGGGSKDGMEIRYGRERLGGTDFFPDRLAVSVRRWEGVADRTVPRDAPKRYVGGLDDDIAWLDPADLGPADDSGSARRFDDVAVDWLEAHVRGSFADLWDDELVTRLLLEAPPICTVRLRALSFPRWQLGQVVAELVTEGVPITSADALLSAVADVHGSTGGRLELLVPRLRERFRADICRAVRDDAGRVSAILLDAEVEHTLMNRISQNRPIRVVELRALVSAVRRQAEELRNDPAKPPPVLVTLPQLRPILARWMRGPDPRLPVLSLIEAEEDLSPVSGGILEVPEIVGTDP